MAKISSPSLNSQFKADLEQAENLAALSDARARSAENKARSLKAQIETIKAQKELVKLRKDT